MDKILLEQKKDDFKFKDEATEYSSDPTKVSQIQQAKNIHIFRVIFTLCCRFAKRALNLSTMCMIL